MSQLTDLSIAEASTQIAAKAISPVELTRAHLERIETLNPKLNAYLLVSSDLALEQARTAETEILHGQYRGALHGIPLALKDLYETKGLRTSAGSPFLRNNISPKDSTAMRKLYEAGAILLGKLNMHEWALGVTGDNPHFGVCLNPHDPERICGGSSSGSAAATAAHMAMGTLGSDTRGSIRIPAALCGIVGLKPTYGRVSLNGAYPLSWNLDHGGPMTRTVEDAALLLNAISGYDADDPFSSNTPTEDFTADMKNGIQGWRIAVDTGSYTGDSAIVSAEVQMAYQQAAQTLRDLGANTHEVDMGFLIYAYNASRGMVSADAAAFHQLRLMSDPEMFGEDVLKRLRGDQPPNAAAYAQIRHDQMVLKRQFDRFFREFDLLLLPTVPFPAVRRDDTTAMDKGRLHYSRFTAPFNMAGVPAISVPCGVNAGNMPIGLQIIGGVWQESPVIRAAWAWEHR
ncbi:MAG: amidase [Anaerolineae bacterium]